MAKFPKELSYPPYDRAAYTRPDKGGAAVRMRACGRAWSCAWSTVDRTPDGARGRAPRVRCSSLRRAVRVFCSLRGRYYTKLRKSLRNNR